MSTPCTGGTGSCAAVDTSGEMVTPYINFHRPCFFAHIVTDAKGRQRRTYPTTDLATPYEKLKSLPNAKAFLKPGVTFASLDQIAYAHSDNHAAQQLNQARQKLFNFLFRKTAA